MNFFKSILSFFNKPTIEIDWNPYLVTDELNNLIIFSPKGFKVNVFTDVDFVFFEFNKYHFCIKKDSTVSDWDSILKIINETKIFHLNLESINEFFRNYGYKISEDFYVPIPSFLTKNKPKKIYREFNNHRYYEIDVFTKKILKNVYKIKVINKTMIENSNVYFVQDWFFKISDLATFSKNIRVYEDFYLPKYFPDIAKEKRVYGVSNKVSSIVNMITDIIDLESVKTLTSYGLTFQIVKFNDSRALIGITEKHGTDPIEIHCKKENHSSKKINKYSKFCKYYAVFENNELKLIHHSEKDLDVEFSKQRFVIYYFIGDKIVRDVLKTREADIERYQTFVFSNLNRKKLFEKYPSSSILKELVENGIISRDQKPVIEDLNLLEMMKI